MPLKNAARKLAFTKVPAEKSQRKMLLSEYNATYAHTHDFGMNLDKEKTTEVKGRYQKRKGIIL